jgi:hypothetical protein
MLTSQLKRSSLRSGSLFDLFAFFLGRNLLANMHFFVIIASSCHGLFSHRLLSKNELDVLRIYVHVSRMLANHK